MGAVRLGTKEGIMREQKPYENAIEKLRKHFNQMPVPNSKMLIEERDRVNAMIDVVEEENARLRNMCSELYRRYWDVEGEFFIDPEMGKLEEKLRELGIETCEAWE